MNQDVTDGASKISFYAAKWGTDATPTLQVLYSTNGGSTWTAVGTCQPNGTWQQYIFNLNVTGNVRFKIQQTVGARLNIDDIAITSNNSAPVTDPKITAPVNGSTVNVGTIPAMGTSVSKTITVKGSDLTQALNLSVSGNGFSVSPTTISAASANAGTSVTVTYSSNVAGTAAGSLTIGSSEASVTVTLMATKVAMPSIAITSPSAMEAEQGGESTVVQGTVSADNNDDDITLAVEGNFELSLNRTNWSRSLTLDPSGEVFYIRLADTGTAGDFYGSLSATTSIASAYADVQGTVNAKQVTPGDVNMDGKVSIGDVTVLISYLMGGTVDPFDALAADVNNSGNITIADVTALINKLMAQPATQVAGWDAYPADGGISFENNSGEMLEVFDYDGECCAVVMTPGITTVDLPAGIYVVATDNMSRKVVVK